MKILYLAHSDNLHGAGRALLHIIEELRLLMVDIVVVLPDNEGVICAKLQAMGIGCFFAPICMAVYPPLKSFRDNFLFLPRLTRLLLYNSISFLKIIYFVKKINPNIIHSNVGPIHIGSLVARIMHIPHVWHIREFQDLDFGWTPVPYPRYFRNKLHKKNNHLISITKAVSCYFQLKDNACIIYDGVFDTRVIPEIKKKKKNYFLFVGRLEEAKGIDDVITAFIGILPRYRNYELWIAGDGILSYTENLRLKVESSGLSERIKFLGFCTDVYSLMSEAMALIVPSRFEGFGFITAEAMFNGCLVIGNNVAGTKEQFDNGVSYCGQEIGIRYSGKEELVKSIRQVCEDGIYPYLQLLEKAQDTAVKLYSSENNARKIFELYNQIIKKA